MSAEPRLSGQPIARATRADAGRGVQPVQIWSSIGTLLLALQIYFTIKWIGSDQFVDVPGAFSIF